MKWASRLTTMIRGMRDAGRLMVGIPSYDTYLAHLRGHHPDATPMTEAEFFRDRQKARFGAGRHGGLRCC